MLKPTKKHDVATFFGQRILLVVPHPDDETLMCAGAIARARKKEAQVFTMVLTHGCDALESLSASKQAAHTIKIRTRKEEFLNVAKQLDIQVISFGKRAAHTVHLSLDEIWPEVKATLETYGIDQIWVPAYEGGHPDHDAVNGMVSIMLKEISILEFSAYHFADRKLITNAFIVPSGHDQVLLLTAEEQRLKKSCLDAYASMKKKLQVFHVIQEMFRPLPRYNYRKIPHKPPLYYQRNHWLPLRFGGSARCRIKPGDVLAAIEAFKRKAAARQTSTGKDD